MIKKKKQTTIHTPKFYNASAAAAAAAQQSLCRNYVQCPPVRLASDARSDGHECSERTAALYHHLADAVHQFSAPQAMPEHRHYSSVLLIYHRTRTYHSYAGKKFKANEYVKSEKSTNVNYLLLRTFFLATCAHKHTYNTHAMV